MKLQKRNLKVAYLPEFKSYEVTYYISKDIVFGMSYDHKPTYFQISHDVKDFIDFIESI